MSNIVKGMKKVMASTFTLYLKTHYFHWNITGSDFEQLHAGLFQKQYDELHESVDEIAEQIRTLGSYAPGSYERFGELSVVETTKAVPKAGKMIETLIADNEAVVKVLNEVAEYCRKENDEATLNLIAERLSAHKKHIWMLKSSL